MAGALIALAVLCVLLIVPLPLLFPSTSAAREIILAALLGCLGLVVAVYVVWDLAKAPSEAEAPSRGPASKADPLSELVLTGVDLQDAVLPKAQLADSGLAGALLARADLRSANLSNADLRGADLRGADLRDADLSGAQIDSAHFKGAYHNPITKWPGDGTAPIGTILVEAGDGEGG